MIFHHKALTYEDLTPDERRLYFLLKPVWSSLNEGITKQALLIKLSPVLNTWLTETFKKRTYDLPLDELKEQVFVYKDYIANIYIQDLVNNLDRSIPFTNERLLSVAITETDRISNALDLTALTIYNADSFLLEYATQQEVGTPVDETISTFLIGAVGASIAYNHPLCKPCLPTKGIGCIFRAIGNLIKRVTGRPKEYKAPPAKEAVWVTQVDERVCKVCAPKHGTPIINIATDDYEAVNHLINAFSYYGVKKQNIGLPSVSPPAHPNCRCFVALVDSSIVAKK
jgi:hypothetical protein